MEAQNGKPQWKLQQRAHDIKNWSQPKIYNNGKENYPRGKQQQTRWCRRKDSVQLLSRVWLFAAPWTAGFPVHHQLLELKLMSIESAMPSNHLILCHPLLPPSIFPSIRVFSKEVLTLGGQSIGVSASASVLPMNIQDWFPLGLTGWIFTTLEYRLEGITQSEQQKETFFKWA